MADCESKGQKAGKLIYGEDDMGKCQNHRLKKVYEAGSAGTTFYKSDFEAMSQLTSQLCLEGNLNKSIVENQVCFLVVLCFGE
jgi:hypothetical protein